MNVLIIFAIYTHSNDVGAAEAPALVLGGVPISLTALKVILQILLTGLNVACWFVPMKVRHLYIDYQSSSFASCSPYQ